ncbi:protein lethal(2)essential for life-like [Spodoptera frugiperda]|uniref:Protein lethal(2)essential for life-like n=1 Tax=Spodoptera frugiperda TaxID=7108 RepID=A0A9R0DG65_SPOFR|nr:protein lethal(2)essential for life-like [Spodoptera frugiperda]
MASRQSKDSPENQERCLVKVPVQLTDLSIFDNTYAYMKERFTEEMRRIEQQMNKFSTDLTKFYSQATTVHTNLVQQNDKMFTNWDMLTNSPLVQGEGEDKKLKLQFDVSQFDPTEITVKVTDDMLVVSANHEEKTSDSMVYRGYNREFKLPPGTDPGQVVSSLSRDGVLTVQAPLPYILPAQDSVD